jgi:hypothetical protein
VGQLTIAPDAIRWPDVVRHPKSVSGSGQFSEASGEAAGRNQSGGKDTVGHEAILYGRIVSASGRPGPNFSALQDRNRTILNHMAWDDDWPWLVRSMFSLLGHYPKGTYRRQVIHFGASIKDEPCDRSIWDVWFVKFEKLLQRLYWSSAVVHLATDFEPDRVFEWLPTEAALSRLYEEHPHPVTEWIRSVRVDAQQSA